MTTRCHHRRPSNQWTVSRLAWRGSRCSWSALRTTASPTETADALWTWLRRVLSPGKWSVNKAFCFLHTHPASPTLLSCNSSSTLPFVYSRVSFSLYLCLSNRLRRHWDLRYTPLLFSLFSYIGCFLWNKKNNWILVICWEVLRVYLSFFFFKMRRKSKCIF